ncbi:MAG: hypothetical protein IH859_06170 [Chloroflexi bacterium]|nr:hypothetical protein [Chloroflexota bacterium]
MRLGRLFIVIALVLIIGVAGLFFVLQQSDSGAEDGVADQPEVTLVAVVIVSQPILRGETITAEKLTIAEIPLAVVIQDVYINDPAEVVGARARYDLLVGVFLSPNMVLMPGEGLTAAGSDASLDIQVGRVAIAIPIDRFSSVAYGLQRGDHVNIIASLLFVDIDTEFQTILPNSSGGVIAPGNTVVFTTPGGDGASSSGVITVEGLEAITAQTVTGGAASPLGRTEFDGVLNQPFYIVPSESRQRPRLVSQTIMQDAIVIHVGDFPIGAEDDPNAAAPTDPAGQPGDPNAQGQEVPEEQPVVVIQPPSIITIMVFPQEAVTLNFLVLMGAHLNLVMRASGDDSRVFTEAVTLDWLLANHNIPVPSRLPYGFQPSLERIISPGALDILDLILSGTEGQ